MHWPLKAAMLGLGVITACAQPPSSKSSEPPGMSRAVAPTHVEPPESARPKNTAAAPSSPAVAAPRAWPPPAPGKESDFCIDTVDVLDESTCYVLPDSLPDELLIYLHGIVPPDKTSRQKVNFERVVSAASRRANVAALMPRGRQGLAPKGHERWWGWPTSRATYQTLAQVMVAEIAQKKRALEELVGRPFQRVYLAGSSSGAYFVTALALHGALPADGYALISGAADRADIEITRLPRTPIYIGFGTSDSVGAAARDLGARLQRAGFPVKLAEHPLPHGTAEIYLDEAFAHFRSAVSN